jgi:hypothetical protein
MKKHIVILILLSFLIAGISLCVNGEKKENPKKEKSSSLAEIQACKKSQDCVKVREGCCSCSMGGKELAIHKNHREYWSKELQLKCREKRICLAVFRCTLGKACCDAGTCRIQGGQTGEGKNKKTARSLSTK